MNNFENKVAVDGPVVAWLVHLNQAAKLSDKPRPPQTTPAMKRTAGTAEKRREVRDRERELPRLCWFNIERSG